MATMPEHVLLQTVHSGEAVLLNLEDESYFGLNEVGARMVNLMLSETTKAAVLDALAADYDTDPETLRGDLEELVESLQSRGLIDVS
jgi:hypothetical protein